MDDTDNLDHEMSADGAMFIVPECEEDLKPVAGRSFPTFKDAIKFYKIYAEKCGFDIRKGTKQWDPKDRSLVLRQYVYCNREGFNKPVTVTSDPSSSKKRRSVSKRCGCMARISIRFDSAKRCVIERFVEGHSHKMILFEYKKYMKANRKLGYLEKSFNNNCARVNIGPSKAFQLFKETVGNHSNIGSIASDWKNYARDRKAYIDGCDAQLVLRKMALKKESCLAFYYSYSVDENDRLKCLFWADPVARRNYVVFGDVVSFDCTYNTNRCNMIFAPFTGKDNHGKIVTYGAALLPGEDNTVYGWVFEKFKECMGRSPLLIITDQDPAMKIAVGVVFSESAHRLCMWHIMMKVPEKTPPPLRKNEDFRRRLNETVWSNMITPSEFEQQWNNNMVDFELMSEKWFCDLYHIRHFWIPAYFRDLPMSGICRTTSISESVNSFFRHFLSSGSNLVEFMMYFDSAMDAQRETNDMMNSSDKTPAIIWKTPMPFEKHAATVYTTSTFLKVQKEIEESCSLCSTKNVEYIGGRTIFAVSDGSENMLTVAYVHDEDNITCSCNKFIRDGLLCNHIFSLFNHFSWIAIPQKYIVPRWTKTAYANPITNVGDYELDRCIALDDNKKKIHKMVSTFYTCIGVVDGDHEKMKKLMDGICRLLDELKSEIPESNLETNNTDLFDNFYGMSRPDEVEVHPPLHVKIKGSCSRKKSRAEANAARAEKAKRKSRACGLMGYHDSRNCPNGTRTS